MPQHALTVDLEEWYHGIELPIELWPSDSRLEMGLDPLLRLLEGHGVRATFFVLGAVAEREPCLVADLASRGHEIACHGFAHEFVYRQTPEQFRDDVRRARDVIESATGAGPRGYRAPYFSIRADSLWALDVLAEEGFQYDSSIFPVRNYRYGLPGSPAAPHERVTRAGTLVELPMTPVRLSRMSIPFSGGAYLRILPLWFQRLAWALEDKRDHRVVAYVHPWELDPDHPRIDLPPRVSLTHYARLRLTERRLDGLLQRYRFGRMDDVFGIR